MRIKAVQVYTCWQILSSLAFMIKLAIVSKFWILWWFYDLSHRCYTYFNFLGARGWLITIFPKTSWYIDGCPIRVIKWTPSFSPQHDTPIVPIWISFLLLPIYFRAKNSLFALAKAIGTPIRINEATSDLHRLSEAIEVNMEY